MSKSMYYITKSCLKKNKIYDSCNCCFTFFLREKKLWKSYEKITKNLSVSSYGFFRFSQFYLFINKNYNGRFKNRHKWKILKVKKILWKWAACCVKWRVPCSIIPSLLHNSLSIWLTLKNTRISCGLYYKHVTIVNDASSGVNKWRYNLERHFWWC